MTRCRYSGSSDGTISPSGGNNDQTAISIALLSKGKVTLGDGEFIVSTPILMPSNTTLEGQGAATIIKVADGVDDIAITNLDRSGGNVNIVLRDFSVDGNNLNQTFGTTSIISDKYAPGSTDHGLGSIDFVKVAGLTVENIIVERGYFSGIETLECSDFLISNCTVSYSADDGIGVNDMSFDGKMTNCAVSYSGRNAARTSVSANGIEVQDGCFNVVVSENNISECYSRSISVDSHSGEPENYNISILGNVCLIPYLSTSGGIGVSGNDDPTYQRNITITGNSTFSQQGAISIQSMETHSGGAATQVNATAHGFADQDSCDISQATDVPYNAAHTITRLDGDSFTIPVAWQGSTRTGFINPADTNPHISLANCKSITVAGNSINSGSQGIFFSDNTDDGVQDVSITGNTIKSNKYGIYFETGAGGSVNTFKRISCSGNTINLPDGSNISGGAIRSESYCDIDGFSYSGGSIYSGATGTSFFFDDDSTYNDIAIIGNTINTNASANPTAGAISFQFIEDVTKLRICDNDILVAAPDSSTVVYALRFTLGCTDGLISGNRFEKSPEAFHALLITTSLQPYDSLIIESNTLSGSRGDNGAMDIDGIWTNCSILNNRMYNQDHNASSAGIIFASTLGASVNCLLSGNNYTGSNDTRDAATSLNNELPAGWRTDEPNTNKRTLSGVTEAIEADETGKVFQVDLTTNATHIDLPAATVGLEFTFVCTNATQDGMQIDPDGTETIALANGVQEGAGEYITNATAEAIGDTCRLKCRIAGQWEHFDSVGTWTGE